MGTTIETYKVDSKLKELIFLGPGSLIPRAGVAYSKKKIVKPHVSSAIKQLVFQVFKVQAMYFSHLRTSSHLCTKSFMPIG